MKKTGITSNGFYQINKSWIDEPKADLKTILDQNHSEVFAVFEGDFKDAKAYMVQEQETLEAKFKLSIQKINKQKGISPMKHKTKTDLKPKAPVVVNPEDFKKMQIGNIKATATGKTKPAAKKDQKAKPDTVKVKPVTPATGKTCKHTWKDRKGKDQTCTNEAFKKLGEVDMCKKHFHRFSK